MPLDGHSYLVSQGWSGTGSGLRNGAISRPLAIPQKRNLAGLGKDRDEAFPFWDHVFSAAASAIQVKISSEDEEDASDSTPAVELKRTSTGIISNKRPAVGTPASSGTSTPALDSASGSVTPRLGLMATAKKEAARRGLYSRFFKGPILGPDDVETEMIKTEAIVVQAVDKSIMAATGVMKEEDQGKAKLKDEDDPEGDASAEKKRKKKRKASDAEPEEESERKERKRRKRELKAAEKRERKHRRKKGTTEAVEEGEAAEGEMLGDVLTTMDGRKQDRRAKSREKRTKNKRSGEDEDREERRRKKAKRKDPVAIVEQTEDVVVQEAGADGQSTPPADEKSRRKKERIDRKQAVEQQGDGSCKKKKRKKDEVS